MLLGARGVQRWATVLVLAGMPDQPHVLLVTALVRARMCELLSDDPARTDRAFTVGMFSVINRLLGLPMREALEALPLSDDVVGALLRGEGGEGRSLRTVLAWELGDFSAARRGAGRPRARRPRLPRRRRVGGRHRRVAAALTRARAERRRRDGGAARAAALVAQAHVADRVALGVDAAGDAVGGVALDRVDAAVRADGLDDADVLVPDDQVARLGRWPDEAGIARPLFCAHA